jgi:hypothetical protein
MCLTLRRPCNVCGDFRKTHCLSSGPILSPLKLSPLKEMASPQSRWLPQAQPRWRPCRVCRHSAKSLQKGSSQKPTLFAVGPGSASSLAGWASFYGLGPNVTAPPQGSGVEAFLQLLQADANRTAHEANTLFVLLESTTNQPDLAQGLCNKGLRVARLGVYERIDHPLQRVPACLATSLVCVVVSSSALVARAVEGLASQGLAPTKAHWFCHHIKIIESLKKANLPLVHQLTDLAPPRIIAKVIELSRMND